MSSDGIWINTEDGEEFVLYSDLEEEQLRQIAKPIGGFIFPAGLFMATELATVPFYVKDWLPKQGKLVIYAPAKAGKSYLCIQLARCIGAEEPFLGLPTTKGSVLYVQFELGPQVLQSRLQSTRQVYEDVFVGTTFSMKLDHPQGQERLELAVGAVRPNVLILDPLYKAMVGDENEAADMMKVLNFLDDLIEHHKCSIVLIHHAGKDINRRGRGSSVLEDWADSYIQMKRVEREGSLTVEIRPQFLRHAALPPEPVEAAFVNYEFLLTSPAKTVKQTVLEEITKAGRRLATPADLTRLGLGSSTSIYKALKELETEGKIRKEEWGKYGATTGNTNVD